MVAGRATTRAAIIMKKIQMIRPMCQRITWLFPLLLITACASMPSGPSVVVLPGKGVHFDQFRSDDYVCREYAYTQAGGVTAQDAAVNSGLNTAAIGAALGAIAGVALGGGHGAAVGAGTGLLAGGLIGTDSARASGYMAQQRYDQGYVQCMYAKGHGVPTAGTISSQSQYEQYGRPAASLPPPPPGYGAPVYR